MKFLKFTVFSLLCFSPAALHADDILIIDDGNDSVVEGTITDTGHDRIDIEVDGKKITIDTDDLNLDDPIDTYFKTGTKIQAVGHFDDGEFVAEKVISRGGSASPTINLESDL